MTPQVTVESKAIGHLTKTVEHLKVTHINFVAPIQFGGVSQALSVGRNVDSIQLARMEPDLTAILCEKGQKGDGVLVRRTIHNRISGIRETTQAFVPFANVAEIGYGI